MQKTGGQLLVDCLMGFGARRGFGVPGESYLAVLDGMHSHAKDFDFVICRQEGGAAYMAEAWARITGEPGLCFVTRGPGATNASIGVHSAMQGSVPMILFIGQAARSDLGRECFQEVDYVAMFGPLAKWVVQIEDADRIPEVLARAWVLCQSGRPGPVVISLPEDVLSAMVEQQAPGQIALPREAAPQSEDLDTIKEALQTAQRPLVLVGGGGWNEEGLKDLKTFVDSNGLPLVTVMRYHGYFDNTSENYVGESGVGMLPYLRSALAEADVILALNIRFGEMTTAAYSLYDLPFPKQKILHCHADPDELGKVLHPTLAMQAGPNAMSHHLGKLSFTGSWGSWRKGLRDSYLEGLIAPKQPGELDLSEIMQYLQKTLPNNAVLASGAGNFSIWTNKHFCYGQDQNLIAPQSGTMGYGLPAGIAAKIEDPDRPVVVFSGDGDFQMNFNELGTALQAGAMPVVLVINNGSYGTIRMHQERDYPDRVSGTDIVNPDFVAIASGYGMWSERITKTNEFAPAFEKAMAASGGALLELVVDIEGLTPRATMSQIRGS